MSLPRLIDHGRLGDDYCLILDWLPGIDLGEFLKRVDAGRTPRPSVTESLRLVRGLSRSLRLLHDDCRVVHGDLKPENLILTVKPSSLRLIDFGSSWQIERTRYRVPGDGFDPHYAAPENFADEPRVSAASDQFSVGVILFRMLTLQLPYEGLGGTVGYPEYRAEFDGGVESAGERLERKDELPDQLKRDIDCLLGTMLRIDPAERYPNSRAWTDAIDRVTRRIDDLADPPDMKPTVLDRAANWFLSRFAGPSGRQAT